MGKIVAIGANVMDTIVSLPKYPNEDTKMRACNVMAAGGGPAATGLVAAKKLGADCAFAGNLSNDEGGTFLLNDFLRFGVDTSLINIIPNHRSFISQIWLSNESATRTCVFDKGDLPPLELNDEQIDAIKNADILMVDGNELDAAVEAAKIAKENGVRILYDAGGMYEGVEKLLEVSDILIPSKEFALGMTGKDNEKDAAKALFEKYDAKVCVVTCGKDGGIMYDGESTVTYPSYPANVVDSNGAGDVFHGAFAAALTFGFDYLTCCHFASATSALKCEKVGARDAVPSKEQVIEHLRKNNFEI